MLCTCDRNSYLKFLSFNVSCVFNTLAPPVGLEERQIVNKHSEIRKMIKTRLGINTSS